MRRSGALVLVLAAVMLAGCTTTGSTSTDSGDTVDLLHDRGAAREAVDAITKAVGADPAHVSEVDLYGEYLIAEAQDPTNEEHIDSFTWRDGEVEPATPVHLSGPQEEVTASLFLTSAVRWQDIPTIVRRAERAAETATPIRVEEARASYVYVQRSTSSDLDGRVTIRISIEGPRRSASVELTATGEILTVSVS
jgi:hypothetical protein